MPSPAAAIAAAGSVWPFLPAPLSPEGRVGVSLPLQREEWVPHCQCFIARMDWAYTRAHYTCSCHHWQLALPAGCWQCLAFLASHTLSRGKSGCLLASVDWPYMRAHCICSCHHWQWPALPVGSVGSCQLAACWQCLAFLASPTIFRRKSGCLFANVDWAYMRAHCTWQLPMLTSLSPEGRVVASLPVWTGLT